MPLADKSAPELGSICSWELALATASAYNVATSLRVMREVSAHPPSRHSSTQAVNDELALILKIDVLEGQRTSIYKLAKIRQTYRTLAGPPQCRLDCNLCSGPHNWDRTLADPAEYGSNAAIGMVVGHYPTPAKLDCPAMGSPFGYTDQAFSRDASQPATGASQLGKCVRVLEEGHMGTSLQFMDCPHCGKRVRTEAAKCHHCHSLLSITSSGKALARRDPSIDEGEPGDNDQSHYALNGGYNTADDDFDYDEYLANEFPDADHPARPRVKPWVWITAWLLIFATLLPFFFYFLVR